MADESQNQKRRDLTTVITWLTALRALYPGSKNLEPDTAREYAMLLLEYPFPVTLFTDRTRRFVSRECSYYPSPKELVTALGEHHKNLERERHQRGARSTTTERTPERIAWANKILAEPKRFDADAVRVARSLLTPEEIAEAAEPSPQPAWRPMPKHVIRAICRHLDPHEASLYRRLMAIPTEQRTEEERDTIFGLVRLKIKRAGLTGLVPEPRAAK